MGGKDGIDVDCIVGGVSIRGGEGVGVFSDGVGGLGGNNEYIGVGR